MEQINLGVSRYGDERLLIKQKDNVWSTSGFKKVQYIRVQPTEIENEYELLDFDGGPMLHKGLKISANEVIDKIIYENGIYLIYTKNINDEQNKSTDQ